jgi:hypothetical protein
MSEAAKSLEMARRTARGFFAAEEADIVEEVPEFHPAICFEILGGTHALRY